MGTILTGVKAELKYQGFGKGGNCYGQLPVVILALDDALVESESKVIGVRRSMDIISAKILAQIKTHRSYGQLEQLELLSVVLQ